MRWRRRRATAADDRSRYRRLVDGYEIHKIPTWSETVKRLLDEDTRARRPLRVVLLGSAPLLIGRGLTESLAGRFETLHLPHWSFAEMRDAFGWSLDEYLFYGGYPGAAPLIGEPARWSRYLADSLIETSIARDVLLLTRVDKPGSCAACSSWPARYSGQDLSYTKMLGQLHDAGNTSALMRPSQGSPTHRRIEPKAVDRWSERLMAERKLSCQEHLRCFVARTSGRHSHRDAKRHLAYMRPL
jgi:hypothetical protein